VSGAPRATGDAAAGTGASDDERRMDLALAAAVRGRTAPNPHVGAVIVRDGVVIATGHHERAGEAHAEIVALREAGERARGATLYCTLEPCNHHGRTPPCTDAILAAGIARVVIGCADPARHGPTSGAARLREAGIETVLGVREREAREAIEDFACVIEHGRPLVVLKAAVTLDGRVATRTGDSKWITGEEARREAHRLRDRADAVVVGIETVLADDPRLDVRMVQGRDPIRIVLDTTLRTPETSNVIRHASSSPTWIVHAEDAPRDRIERLASAEGVVLIAAPRSTRGLDLAAVLASLAARDVMRLLVEGGGRVHGALLEADLADRAAIFVAPVILGDPEGRALAVLASPTLAIAAAHRLADVDHTVLGRDVLIRGRIERGRA
jgi:diaminohydroxyphosphoribosylaminopyrimidine deaminase/5-amino-6-(5-phosphoribosylamino)uracil reductase